MSLPSRVIRLPVTTTRSCWAIAGGETPAAARARPASRKTFIRVPTKQWPRCKHAPAPGPRYFSCVRSWALRAYAFRLPLRLDLRGVFVVAVFLELVAGDGPVVDFVRPVGEAHGAHRRILLGE